MRRRYLTETWLVLGVSLGASAIWSLLRMIRLRHRRRRPRQLAGDKGYSYPGVRAHLRRRGIRAVIPRRVDQLGKRGRPAHFDRDAYRRRNAVERCVGWLKGNRGVFTRRAVKLLDGSETKAIRAQYEADLEFQRSVNRYVHDFEAMLRRVLAERDGGAIAVTLMSSDMGRLYAALAQALERRR